jgi:hypothetical protein
MHDPVHLAIASDKDAGEFAHSSYLRLTKIFINSSTSNRQDPLKTMVLLELENV